MTGWLMVLFLVSPAQRPLVEAELSSQCAIEHIAIYSTGYAHFDVSNSCGTAPESFKSGLRQVTSKELERVSATIRAAKFESLPERIEPDPNVVSTEEDLFLLRVWRDGIAKEVSAFGLERAADPGAAQRFQKVWAVVEQFGAEAR